MSERRSDLPAKLAAAYYARPQAERDAEWAVFGKNLARIKASAAKARRECERERELLEEYEAERERAIDALVEAERRRHA